MHKLLPGFLLLVALTACTSLPTYSETLRPWIGQSQERLQQAWGYPQNVFYISPTEKVVTYLEISTRPRNDNTTPYAGYEVAYPAIASPDFGFPSQPQYTNYYCKTSFTIRNGVVVDYSFNGDDCVVTRQPY